MTLLTNKLVTNKALTNKSSQKSATRKLSAIKRTIVIEKLVVCLLIILTFSFFSQQANANNSASYSTEKTHKTIAGKSTQLNKEQVDQQLSKAKEQAFTGQTREQVIAAKTVKQKAKIKAEGRSVYHEFNIYRAYSKLINDNDGDGYFNTFGVVFDADVFSNQTPAQATVYAEIYLREHGGQWQHFFTTQNFELFSDTSDDEFEVISELSTGYWPDDYDVLIDLYEPGYPYVVASISAEETDALYALPLESLDNEFYDEYYEEFHEHGGSFGFILLLISLIALVKLHTGQITYTKQR